MNSQDLAFTAHDGDLKAGSNARNAAVIAWMQETFAQAKTLNSSAIMLISQADPSFDQTDGTRGPLRDPQTLAETDKDAQGIPTPDGYQSFLLALRDQVVAFKRPVMYVHGDSHYFRIDKPFLDATGARLENFKRVETFGDHQENGTNDVTWLKVLVDPHIREVFRLSATDRSGEPDRSSRAVRSIQPCARISRRLGFSSALSPQGLRDCVSRLGFKMMRAPSGSIKETVLPFFSVEPPCPRSSPARC